jgi:hypothetical protein
MPAHAETSLAAAIAAVLLLLAALPAAAQELYIWTDDEGVQHIADRRPEGDHEIRVRRAIAQPESPIEMRNVGSRREPEWQFRNALHGPVSVQIAFSEVDNVVAEPDLPAVLVVPARSHRSVLIGALNPLRAWRYGIDMQAVPGSLDARPDAAYRYRLPFPEDDGIHIGQGFSGTFSHTAPQSRYAVDFSLPVGTPIRAARSGKVMDLERWFHRSGSDLQRDGPRANYVRILHDDGSMAVYAHLDYSGVDVQPGQQVAAGEVIGRSGNTGYSTGPHLHFAVQVNRAMQLVSIPFRMVTRDGQELVLDSPPAGDAR